MPAVPILNIGILVVSAVLPVRVHGSWMSFQKRCMRNFRSVAEAGMAQMEARVFRCIGLNPEISTGRLPMHREAALSTGCLVNSDRVKMPKKATRTTAGSGLKLKKSSHDKARTEAKKCALAPDVHVSMWPEFSHFFGGVLI